ncbi:MAG TPA: hypothetical protein VGB76_10080 [Pyrinomonadaceae bacterium]|jgi:hypothetical protein
MKKAFVSVLPGVALLFPLLTHTPQSRPSLTLAPREVSSTISTARRPEQERLDRLHAQIRVAKKLLAVQPAPPADAVHVAFEDGATDGLNLLTLPKEFFRRREAEASVKSSRGHLVHVRIVRANGVNTAVTISDAGGRAHVPLLIRYPIKQGGTTHSAYYTSVHPALESTELAREGRAYVRRMLDEAAGRLAATGVLVAPDIIDVAERLCIVEHADHDRFRTEDQAALFAEIASLYALNAGDTYRYSVSSAGAGGMVQMIPSTYRMVRERHPEARLNPDFASGMRDHSNALEAMLLYMHDTWNDLIAEEAVVNALNTRTATQVELLAAGYNSNPARLAGYLARGGESWRTLIPRETQAYLQIYASVVNRMPASRLD